MKTKVLECLLKEMAAKIAKGGDTDELLNLVRSSNGKIAKAVEEHRPVLESRVLVARAKLMAEVAEIDALLEEIKAP